MPVLRSARREGRSTVNIAERLRKELMRQVREDGLYLVRTDGRHVTGNEFNFRKLAAAAKEPD
jgi:hypothetical protein